jgi:hypothetical protein
MAAIYGGKIYYGSDAVVLLSSMTNGRGWAGRFLAVLLRRTMSRPNPDAHPHDVAFGSR